MPRILNIAEKPSVAKSISNILSIKCRTERGKHKYCPNIFFSYNGEMIFTSVLGHLFSYDFENKMKWDECDPYTLFESELSKRLGKDMEQIANNIKILAQKCDQIIIWTDCDREGENIGAQIQSLVPEKKFKRARFSAISKKEIIHALNNLVEINQNEADAVTGRIELDLRIGSSFTRLQTLAYQHTKHMKDNKNVLSFGPCQIPTLNFVVQRHLEIEKFISEKFYTLQNKISKNSIENIFKWSRKRVFDENCAIYFYKLLKDGKAIITNKKIEKKEKWKPLPLRTVEFQKTCSSYFKMPSNVLMEIAEKLYNDGYISYPRTETDAFPSDFDYNGIINKLKNDEVLGNYASTVIFKKPRSGKNDDHAHSPIYPLKAGHGLEGNRRKIYEFVARRFLGSISDNARGLETEYEMCIVSLDQDIPNFTEKFSASGLNITERNYLDIYIYDKWESTLISDFDVDEMIENELEIVTGSTEPPNYLKETDLIGLMDKNGIGTDATIHEHIHKIQDRGYVFKKNLYFIPYSLGINLIEAYNTLDLGISEPILRKTLEEKLQKVSRGLQHKDDLLRDEIKLYKKIYKKFADGIDLFKKIIVKERKEITIKPLSKSTEPARNQMEKGNEGNFVPPKRASPPSESENNFGLSGNQFKRDVSSSRIKNKNNTCANHGIKPVNFRCDCGIMAKELIAKKGSNSNRQFFVCGHDPRKCKFFKWEDETYILGNGENIRNDKRRIDNEFGENIKCDCGSDPIKKIANTEANKGRAFFCCNRSYKKCKFFKWIDE